MLLEIDTTGHFVFKDSPQEDITHALKLVYESHIKGKVDTSDYLYRAWLNDWGFVNLQKDNILVWTTVFIPRLMFSLLVHFGALVEKVY